MSKITSCLIAFEKTLLVKTQAYPFVKLQTVVPLWENTEKYALKALKKVLILAITLMI